MLNLKKNNIIALLILSSSISSAYANKTPVIKTGDLITFYNEEQSFLSSLLNDPNSYIMDKKIVNDDYVKPKFEQHYKYSYLLNYRIYNSYLLSNSTNLDEELSALQNSLKEFKCKKLKKDKSECLYNELTNNTKIEIIKAVKLNNSSEQVKQLFSGEVEIKAYTYFKGIIVENNTKK